MCILDGPFLQIQFGSGALISIIFNYKFGILWDFFFDTLDFVNTTSQIKMMLHGTYINGKVYNQLWELLETELGDTVLCDQMADRIYDLLKEHYND